MLAPGAASLIIGIMGYLVRSCGTKGAGTARIQYKPLRLPASRLAYARKGFLDGTGERQHQAGDCLYVIKMRMRQMGGKSVRSVGGYRRDGRILG